MMEGHSLVAAGMTQVMLRVERDERRRKSDNVDRFQQCAVCSSPGHLMYRRVPLVT